MAAPTNYYVDPAIAANTGAGTIGDPYGDLQHALNSVTRDSSNGDCFNVKAGTDEVLTATLTTSTYGTPTANAPIMFRGYTSAANDGGIGGISGAGTYAIWDDVNIDGVMFKDMHLHNCGSATYILRFDNDARLVRCEIDNCSGGGVYADRGLQLVGCNLHNIGAIGVTTGTINIAPYIYGCYFKNGANSFTTAITQAASSQSVITHCIFSLSGTSNAISFVGKVGAINHNSIFTTGSGTGISITSGDFGETSYCLNNLLEGWTTGLLFSATTTNQTAILSGNAAFNCTTAFNINADHALPDDNETLGATPFAKSGSDTYANRATYFKPVDTGNVYSPYAGMASAKGAIQDTAAAGGGTSGRQSLHAIEAGGV